MAKVDLENVTSGFQTTNTINDNNDRIEEFSDTVLSRVGDAPNAMEADLDMNSNRILNAPFAATGGEPVTLEQLQEFAGLDPITLPPQSGQADKVLSTDGVVAGWVDNIVEKDPTPTLAGDLDVDTNSIISTGGNDVVVDSDNDVVIDANNDVRIIPDVEAEIVSPAITLTAGTTLTFNDNTFPQADGSPGDFLRTDGAGNLFFEDQDDVETALPRGHVSGLITDRNSSVSVRAAVGECRSSDDTSNIKLTSQIRKSIDVDWAEGDNMGGFPSGLTLTADTWYHYFLIQDPTDTNIKVDAGFDSDVNAANLLADATGYTKFRRIASVITNSGGTSIVNYDQKGDTFLYRARVNPVNRTFSSTDNTFEDYIEVPLGIEVEAILVWMMYYSTQPSSPNSEAYGLVTSTFSSDQTPTVNRRDVFSTAINTSSTPAKGEVRTRVWTDTDAEVRTRVVKTNSDGTITSRIDIVGWVDRRGQDD